MRYQMDEYIAAALRQHPDVLRVDVTGTVAGPAIRAEMRGGHWLHVDYDYDYPNGFPDADD
jgi:hypothetical protein